MKPRVITELQQWIKDNLIDVNGNICGSRLHNHTLFYKNNVEMINSIDTLVKIDNIRIGVKCTCILNNIFENPKCECGNNTKWIPSLKNFRRFCSNTCSGNNKDVQQSKRIKSLSNIDKNGLNSYQRIGAKNSIIKQNYTNDVWKVISNKRDLTKRNDIDKGGLNSYERGIIKQLESKRNNIDENGLNIFQLQSIKGLETKLERGLITPKEDKPDVNHYKELVIILTNDIYHNHYYYINPNNLQRGDKYHLDHMYSKHEGFKNKVPIAILCHPCNLEMLESSYNMSKRENCSHTLDELMEKIRKFENIKNLINT